MRYERNDDSPEWIPGGAYSAPRPGGEALVLLRDGERIIRPDDVEEDG